jgi:hypothetical protein
VAGVKSALPYLPLIIAMFTRRLKYCLDLGYFQPHSSIVILMFLRHGLTTSSQILKIRKVWLDCLLYSVISGTCLYLPFKKSHWNANSLRWRRSSLH